jgi:hypothetical protein
MRWASARFSVVFPERAQKNPGFWPSFLTSGLAVSHCLESSNLISAGRYFQVCLKKNCRIHAKLLQVAKSLIKCDNSSGLLCCSCGDYLRTHGCRNYWSLLVLAFGYGSGNLGARLLEAVPTIVGRLLNMVF